MEKNETHVVDDLSDLTSMNQYESLYPLVDYHIVDENWIHVHDKYLPKQVGNVSYLVVNDEHDLLARRMFAVKARHYELKTQMENLVRANVIHVEQWHIEVDPQPPIDASNTARVEIPLHPDSAEYQLERQLQRDIELFFEGLRSYGSKFDIAWSETNNRCLNCRDAPIESIARECEHALFCRPCLKDHLKSKYATYCPRMDCLRCGITIDVYDS